MVQASKNVDKKTGRHPIRSKTLFDGTERVSRYLRDTPEVAGLKKLTSRVLDSLKNPNVIPSDVILAALIEARSL